MRHGKHRVCPVSRAGFLDNRFRRWVHNPRTMLGPYVKEGMTVLDFGCGPGYFTLGLAQMVGESGKVIAADLQEGMLERLRQKIHGTDMEQRIVLHRTGESNIGVSEKIDFALAFYVVHEVPDQAGFFTEIRAMLEPDGLMFMAEPPFGVSRRAFEDTVKRAVDIGFTLVERPKVFLSKAVLLKKRGAGGEEQGEI